jgi:hypothetical protein
MSDWNKVTALVKALKREELEELVVHLTIELHLTAGADSIVAAIVKELKAINDAKLQDRLLEESFDLES